MSSIKSRQSHIDIHSSDWHGSITAQLMRRKKLEQQPFESICSFACSMFDRVDIQKNENIQLSLQKGKLQQELLDIQKSLIDGGSDAAKAALVKIASLNTSDDPISQPNSNLKAQYNALLEEKASLEKKISNLQERLNENLKIKSDVAQTVIDLKSEVEEKDRMIKQLSYELVDRDKHVNTLKEHCQDLKDRLLAQDDAFKTLNDEHIALSVTSKGLEKKYFNLKKECDVLRQRILEAKKEDAIRLNAENERILLRQQEKIKKELEANVSDINKAEVSRIAANDPASVAVAALTAVDLESTQIDMDDVYTYCGPTRVPSSPMLVFDAHDEGEVDAVFWYCYKGLTDDYLASGGSDRKVKLWKIIDNVARNEGVLLGSNASITSMDIGTDVLLASSNDMASRIWSLSDHKLRRTLTGHSAKVLSAKFLGAANKIASGSNDRTLKIWDINRNACTRTYFSGSTCYDLIYHNYMVISGHFDKKIRYWDLRSPNQEPMDELALQSKVTSLDTAQDGNLLLCSVRDDTLKTLDIRTKQVLHTYSAEGFKIGSDSCRAKFSMDGGLIACGSSDGGTYIWNTNTSKLEKTLRTDLNSSTAVACCWCPDRKRLASIGRSKKVTIWN